MRLSQIFTFSALVLSLTPAQADIHHKSCFTGHSDLRIPVRSLTQKINLDQKHLRNQDSIFNFNSPSEGGLTEDQFHQTIKIVSEIYQPIFREKGLYLKVETNWEEPTVSAGAWLNDALTQSRHLNFTGGLARHPLMNQEAFATVICHEIGHHLGGAPKLSRRAFGLLSIEGQADYYATLKCLRRVYAQEDNVQALSGRRIPQTLLDKCTESYKTRDEIALCLRVSLAARQASVFAAEMERLKRKNNIPNPQFETPSTEAVSAMLVTHPTAQCRLDTFFQGALCPTDVQAELDDEDPARGACSERMGDTLGIRPRCWYQPAQQGPSLTLR